MLVFSLVKLEQLLDHLFLWLTRGLLKISTVLWMSRDCSQNRAIAQCLDFLWPPVSLSMTMKLSAQAKKESMTYQNLKWTEMIQIITKLSQDRLKFPLSPSLWWAATSCLHILEAVIFILEIKCSLSWEIKKLEIPTLIKAWVSKIKTPYWESTSKDMRKFLLAKNLIRSTTLREKGLHKEVFLRVWKFQTINL